MAVALGADASRAVPGEPVGAEGRESTPAGAAGSGTAARARNRGGLTVATRTVLGSANRPPPHTHTRATASSFLFRVCEMRVQHASHRGMGGSWC